MEGQIFLALVFLEAGSWGLWISSGSVQNFFTLLSLKMELSFVYFSQSCDPFLIENFQIEQLVFVNFLHWLKFINNKWFISLTLKKMLTFKKLWIDSISVGILTWNGWLGFNSWLKFKNLIVPFPTGSHKTGPLKLIWENTVLLLQKFNLFAFGDRIFLNNIEISSDIPNFLA